MATFAVGTVVLVPFPFTDLSQSTKRPAVVLADASLEDLILCQITSNPYRDARAVQLTDKDFKTGSLHRMSYARPSKLFTGSKILIIKELGVLQKARVELILDKVVDLFKK